MLEVLNLHHQLNLTKLTEMNIKDQIDAIVFMAKQASKNKAEIEDCCQHERFIKFNLPYSQENFRFDFMDEDLESTIRNMPDVEGVQVIGGHFEIEVCRGMVGDEAKLVTLCLDDFIEVNGFYEIAEELLCSLADEAIGDYGRGDFGAFLSKSKRLGLTNALASELKKDAAPQLAEAA